MESKKIVEMLMIGGVLAVSMASQVASATALCDGTGADKTVTSGTFVQQAFPVKCSANVFTDYVDSSATFASVKGMSQKGMHSFAGSTEGGQVKACETTSATFATPTAGTTSGSNGCS